MAVPAEGHDAVGGMAGIAELLVVGMAFHTLAGQALLEPTSVRSGVHPLLLAYDLVPPVPDIHVVGDAALKGDVLPFEAAGDLLDELAALFVHDLVLDDFVFRADA